MCVEAELNQKLQTSVQFFCVCVGGGRGMPNTLYVDDCAATDANDATWGEARNTPGFIYGIPSRLEEKVYRVYKYQW